MAITGEAAILTAPGRVEVRDVDVPGPRSGELLVRTQAAAICGSDVHRVYGQARFFREIGDYDYPCPPGYPGHEGIGEVLESRSPEFRPGQIVLTVPDNTCNRTFASHQVVPDRFALPVPGDLVPMHALMAQQLGTVLYALRRFWPGTEAGETAVVNGTGSAGLFFVQLLKRLGFRRVIAADLVPERLDAARAAGAGLTVQVPRQNVEDVLAEETGGRGADLAVDASGSDAGRAAAMAGVAADGRVGFYGLPEGAELTIPFGTLFRRQATLVCAVGAQQEPGARSFAEALRLIGDGVIPVSAHVTHTFPLPKITHAFEMAHNREDGAVKVGITFD